MTALSIRSVTIRAVDAPMDPPLRNSLNVIPCAPLVIAEIQTEQGPCGTAYAFAYSPATLTCNIGAGLAGPHRVPLSSHIFIEASVHLLSVAPLQIKDGMALIPDAPGLGLDWDAAALARHAADA